MSRGGRRFQAQLAGEANDLERADVGGAVAGQLESEAKRIVTAVRAQWPVATGRSLRAWRVDTDSDGAAVVNDVEYSSLVRDGLADRLIRNHLDQAGTEDRINAVVRREIDP